MRAWFDRAFPRWHRFWYRLLRGNMPGLFGKRRILLLTTTGRRSGHARTTILLYVRDGDDLVVIASNGGAPQHPTWYLNLQASPAATVELGSERFAVIAADITDPDERTRVWHTVVGVFKGYESYAKKTDRVIPLIRLTKTEGT